METATSNSPQVPHQIDSHKILPRNDVHHDIEPENDHIIHDYSNRAQWLRAAILGAIDGLISTASLMMGVGAVWSDVKTMILTGIISLVAGACSMAIGEFVSVYSQYDIQLAQMKREEREGRTDRGGVREKLPSPGQASASSGFAFAVGAAVPLLAAAFVRDYRMRMGVVVAAVTVALLGFGWAAAVIGRAPPVRSSLRVVIGGLLAAGITFGLTKLIGSISGI